MTEADDPAARILSPAEAQLLLMMLRQLARDGSLSVRRQHGLMRRVPLLFPLSERAAVAERVEAAIATGSREVLAALAAAMVREREA